MKNALIVIAAACIMGCSKGGGGGATVTPAVTPIGTHDGTPVTKTIGAGGGGIISADGQMELVIPAGALAGDTQITIQPIKNNTPNGRGKAYRCTPDGIQFSKDITLKFHYTDEQAAMTEPQYMQMAFQTVDGTWEVLNEIAIDETANVISAKVNHFTDFSSFDVMRIEPAALYLHPNQIGEYLVTATGMAMVEGRILLSAQQGAERWQVNGINNGNNQYGTIGPTADGTRGVYTAPAAAPTTNPVDISATINTTFYVDGQRFNQGILTAKAFIIGNKWKVEVETINEMAVGTGEVYEMKDHLRFTVNLVGDSGTVTGIQNSAPTFLKKANSTNGCNTVFNIYGTGPLNPRDNDVYGIVYSAFSKDVVVSFGPNHPVIYPNITVNCAGQQPSTRDFGAWNMSGMVVAFKDNGQPQTLNTSAGGQEVKMTFSPLQ